MSQSVNSTAVLRLMGRAGGPMIRGGRGAGDRGRGRGKSLLSFHIRAGPEIVLYSLDIICTEGTIL